MDNNQYKSVIDSQKAIIDQLQMKIGSPCSYSEDLNKVSESNSLSKAEHIASHNTSENFADCDVVINGKMRNEGMLMVRTQDENYKWKSIDMSQEVQPTVALKSQVLELNKGINDTPKRMLQSELN